jgi:hypothetical protein
MSGMAGVGTAVALGVACVVGIAASAAAQAKAGVVTTLQGTATVARAAAARPAPLRFKDDVFVQDHIVTGESSIVRILLGGKAVVTVRERSALTIHETPTTSTIQIDSGKMALAVARDRMKPGESVQIRTPNAMAGVRGTVVIADVAPPAEAGGAVTTRFTLLTGLVDVVRLDGVTGQAAGQLLTLHPLQTIVVTGGLPPGAVRAISTTEAQSIAADYKVVLPPPPPPANAQVTEQQIEIAVQHSAALTGSQPGAGADASADHDWALGGGAPAGDAMYTGISGGRGSTTLDGTATVGGGGGLGAGASLAVGGGTISASTSVTIGGGTIGAGSTVSAGGGGIAAGGGANLDGGGLGGGVTIGGGTGTSTSSGGLIGGLVPKLLPQQ